MLLINNYRAPGARMRQSPNSEAILQLGHADLEILASLLPGVLAASRLFLLRKQFAEKPRAIVQHGPAFNGLFIFCEAPANYDRYNYNEEGEQWQYSFCRPNDFGDLVPADPFHIGSDEEQIDCY